MCYVLDWEEIYRRNCGSKIKGASKILGNSQFVPNFFDKGFPIPFTVCYQFSNPSFTGNGRRVQSLTTDPYILLYKGYHNLW